MRVQELVEKYNKNQRIDIAKELEVKPYVGIEFKKYAAQLVLDNCTTVTDGKIHIDSVERYILFTIGAIGMHTNLEFSYEENDERSVVDDYDDLCKSGLLTKIIDTFRDDYAACQEILNMMTADRLQYSVTIETKLSQFLDNIQDGIGSTIKDLVAKLNIDDLTNKLPFNQDVLLQLYNSVKTK